MTRSTSNVFTSDTQTQSHFNHSPTQSEKDAALFEAVKAKKIGEVKLLLEIGADINATEDHNHTVLFTACNMGDEEMAVFLLEHGACPKKNPDSFLELIASKDMQYNTNCTRRTIDAFYHYGADFDHPSQENKTPLIWALLDVKTHETALWLLKYNANPNAVGLKNPNFYEKNDEMTPLHAAVFSGALEMVRSLSYLGADRYARMVDDNNYSFITPLKLAQKLNYTEIVDYLSRETHVIPHLLFDHENRFIGASNNEDTTYVRAHSHQVTPYCLDEAIKVAVSKKNIMLLLTLLDAVPPEKLAKKCDNAIRISLAIRLDSFVNYYRFISKNNSICFSFLLTEAERKFIVACENSNTLADLENIKDFSEQCIFRALSVAVFHGNADLVLTLLRALSLENLRKILANVLTFSNAPLQKSIIFSDIVSTKNGTSFIPAVETHVVESTASQRKISPHHFFQPSDLQSSVMEGSFRAHRESVQFITLSPDGQLIISGSTAKDYAITIRNIQTCNKIHRLTGHTRSIRKILVTNDSKKIISSAGDLSIKIWDVQTGNCLHTLYLYSQDIMKAAEKDGATRISLSVQIDFAISEDANQLIVFLKSYGVWKIWNIATGECISELQSKHYEGCTLDLHRPVAISPDSKYVAIDDECDGPLYILDFNTGRFLCEIPHEEDAIGLDTISFVSSHYFNCINKIFDVKTGEQICELERYEEQQIYHFSYAVRKSDNEKIFIATRGYPNKIFVWNIVDGKLLCEKKLEKSFRCMDIMGKQIALGYDDGTIELTSVEEFMKEPMLESKQSLHHS